MNIKLNKNQRLILLVGILLGGGLGICFIGDYAGLWSIAPDTSTEKLTSTFTLIDYRTGEDVTAWVEISVWTPDPDDLPFDEEDPYAITNFDEEESSEDAEEVSIDLRSHAESWLEIDPDFESDYGGYNGVYNALTTRDMRKLVGGANYDYRFYVYHAPSNVSVAMLERGAMASIRDGDASPYNNTFTLGEGAGLSFNRGTDGNYTVYLNMPLFSNDAWHAGVVGGDEWDIDDEELTDMTDAEMEWLRDQSNHRTIAPYYDLTDDNEKDFTDDLERVTNCFAIRYGFNNTVSTTDAAGTQVNLTISERDYNEIPVDIIYDAEFIWAVFYEPITCYDQLYNFDVDISFGKDIYLGNVTTVRLETPEDDNNLGAAVALNYMYMPDLYNQYNGI